MSESAAAAAAILRVAADVDEPKVAVMTTRKQRCAAAADDDCPRLGPVASSRMLTRRQRAHQGGLSEGGLRGSRQVDGG